MPTEPLSLIDVLDSAVKIGLGALIAGGAGLLTVKVNHKREKEKAYKEWRRALLERILEEQATFHNNAIEHFGRQFSLWNDDGSKVDETVPARSARLARIKKISDDATLIKSRITLLMDDQVYQAYANYAECIVQIIRAHSERISPSDERYKRMNQQFESLYQEFIIAIGAAMKNQF